MNHCFIHKLDWSSLFGLARQEKLGESTTIFIQQKKKPLFLGCASFSVPVPAVDEARKLANTVTRMYLNY